MGYIYLHSSQAEEMNVKNGDLIYMVVESWYFFRGLYEHNMNFLLKPNNPSNPANNVNSNQTVDWDKLYQQFFLFSEVYVPVVVKNTFSDPLGKTPVDVTNTALIDYATFTQLIAKNMHPQANSTVRGIWNSTDLYHYAGTVILNLPPPRIQAYLQSDQDAIRKNVVVFGSEVLYTLGFNQIDSSLPVLSKLETTQYFALFLGLILNIVILILLVLSILLIYSLLIVNVETRMFEMGVLRMIGTPRAGVIHLLLIQSFFYAIPSWIVGLICGQILMIIASEIFIYMSSVPIPYPLTGYAIILATALGIVIPLASSILPIRQALQANLHDSLDVKRSKIQPVSVSLERSEDSSFQWAVVMVGGAGALFGFLIYYVLPLALLTLNLSLLLNIFFVLILGMFLGLVMLSLNLEQLIEQILMFVFMFWERKTIKTLVEKNLVAHRKRNRKTTIMFALSVGFIIFIMVSYSSTISGFIYQQKSSHGSLMRIEASGETDSKPNTIDKVSELEQYCSVRAKDYISGFTWTSATFGSVVKGTNWGDSPSIWNIGRTFGEAQRLYAITPNYYDVAFPEFLIIDESRDVDNMLISEQLYTVQGSGQAILGEFYQQFLSLDLNSQFVFSFKITDAPGRGGPGSGQSQSLIRLQPNSFLSHSSVFRFSKFPTSRNQDTLVSWPAYLRFARFIQGYSAHSTTDNQTSTNNNNNNNNNNNQLISDRFESVEDIARRYFMIEFYDSASDGVKDKVKADLKKIVSGSNGNSVWDFRDSVSPILTAQGLLTYFFAFVILIAMVISSFSLVSSMYTNIYEQTKEIGILRAIGIQKSWVKRVYIWEGFIVVLGSSVFGIMIGGVIGYTMVVQRILFTQLEIGFEFPYEVMSVVLLGAGIVSVVAAWGPITTVLKKEVVTIIRYAGT